ncbi:hypothetical protein JHK82_012191 [Glycine max]|nr:hypothetical protein JHK82_012191 [Glycine max]
MIVSHHLIFYNYIFQSFISLFILFHISFSFPFLIENCCIIIYVIFLKILNINLLLREI